VASRSGRWSVRTRTTAAATVVLAIGFVVAGVGLQVLLHRSLITHVDDIADVQLADVTALARQGTLPRELANAGDDGSVVHVVDDRGTVVASSAGSSRAAPGFRPTGTDPEARTLDGRRVSARRVSTPAGPRTIYVSTKLDPVDEAMARLQHALYLVGPLLLVFVGLTTWLVLGRALRPVEAIRARVAGISDRSLGERVPVTSTDELGRLATTMNDMLGRIETGVDRQRRFVGDASHELQTPIASLRADLEVALGHPTTTDWPAIGADLLATSAEMERLVRDLLFIARADEGTAAPTTPVDLDDVVLEEAAALRVRGRVPIDASHVSGAAVLGRRDDLGRVVRNLLDNADRHASTGVTLSLTTDADDVVLLVADDGPGIPPADRERVFERFTRLDEARARATGGTGLGLPIARQIVLAHGGTIVATDAGLVVRLPSI
jgi:signal transduction histidine kinase